MKYYTFVLALAATALFSACGDDKTPDAGPLTDFKITFKARYDGQPFEKNKNYPYDNYNIQISRFSTYLSDITLLKGSEEVKLSDIEWIEFTPDLSPKAVDVPITFAKVPEGDYTGIRFGYGVRPDLNAKRPNNFPAGHPLAREIEYWLGWKSYIFSKVEGQGDSNGDNIADVFLLYHCGSDAVYRSYTFNLPIRVEQNAGLEVTFDAKKLFTVGNGVLDLKVIDNQATSNDPKDVKIATVLMDNFDLATTVEQ